MGKMAGFVLIAGLFALAAIAGTDADVEELAKQAAMKRAAGEAYSLRRMKAGNAALKADHLPEAMTAFREALDKLGQRPRTDPLRQRAEAGLAEALFRQATFLHRDGDPRAALVAAIAARDLGHRRAKRLVRDIERSGD